MNLILMIALLTGVVADDFELPPDIVYNTMTRTGTLEGIDSGDESAQVTVSGREGGSESFWSFDPLLNYFLSLHLDEQVTLDIEDVETWMTDEESMVRLMRVVDATAGETTFEEWSDSLEAEGGLDEEVQGRGSDTSGGDDDPEGSGGR